MEKKYYAHSLEGKPPEEWQPLEVQMKDRSGRGVGSDCEIYCSN